jgi:hypothetical protein
MEFPEPGMLGGIPYLFCHCLSIQKNIRKNPFCQDSLAMSPIREKPIYPEKRQSPSKRRELFYFAERTLGAVRINDYKYHFIDQPVAGSGERSNLTGRFSQICGLTPLERTGMTASIAHFDFFKCILAIRVRAGGSAEICSVLHRFSAHAETGIV